VHFADWDVYGVKRRYSCSGLAVNEDQVLELVGGQEMINVWWTYCCLNREV
jgi:hypothetical protein